MYFPPFLTKPNPPKLAPGEIGIGGALDREACLRGLQEAARTELEASLVRGLMVDNGSGRPA